MAGGPVRPPTQILIAGILSSWYYEKRRTAGYVATFGFYVDQHGIIVPLFHTAGVAELADALDSGSSKGNLVEVRVLSSAFHFLCFPRVTC